MAGGDDRGKYAVSLGPLDTLLERIGLTAAATESDLRFSDGLRYRLEIPSVEGPQVLEAVLEEADRRSVAIRRVSQGSGVMMLTDPEIRAMAAIGREGGIEVSLFIGPRGAWDTGAQSLVSGAVAGAARGRDTLAWCVAEARRACELGIRSLLVGDVGVLWTLDQLRSQGDLPTNLILKTSVVMSPANAASAAVLEQLGAGTVNVATDLSVEQIAEIRRVITVPIDVYVEVPDDQGGFVRFYDIPGLVRGAAPVYLKLGIRNAPIIYPCGGHLMDVACKLGRERVRRAELCLRLLEELAPGLVEKRGDERPDDLAIPEA